jgi:hypothetical protein
VQGSLDMTQLSESCLIPITTLQGSLITLDFTKQMKKLGNLSAFKSCSQNSNTRLLLPKHMLFYGISLPLSYRICQGHQRRFNVESGV